MATQGETQLVFYPICMLMDISQRAANEESLEIKPFDEKGARFDLEIFVF